MLPTRLSKSFVNRSKRLGRRSEGAIGKMLPIFLFLLFLFLLNNLFKIKSVNCSLDGENCPPEITQRFSKYLDTNVLLLNQKQATQSIISSYSVEKVTIGFKMFNTLMVTLEGGKTPILTMVSLVKDLPVLSMDIDSGSTVSANWPRPSIEIETYVKIASASGFGLWENGRMTPVATSESSIKYLISKKPESEIVSSLYRLIKLVNKYLNVQSIQIVGQRVFLSQADQPDIIISVPFDEGRVTEAIKSFSYLVTLKKDAKVIDLRFKNPIIR